MTNSKVSRVILSFDDGRKDNIDVAEKVLKNTSLMRHLISPRDMLMIQ